MHRRSLIICPLLLLAASLISCGDAGHPSVRRSDEKAVRASLVRAEALMESDPHAARAVLDSIARAMTPWQLGIRNEELGIADKNHAQPIIPNSSFLIPNFPRKGEAAHYAWLRTQIDYKCDVPLTSDSLARIATDYYGTPRRPDYHAAMAWYTLGCVYKEMGDDINGTDAFLKAKSLFPDTLIRYYALAEQNLGLHYMKRSMEKEAIHEFQSAKQKFIFLSDSAAVAFQDLKISQCYLYDENDILAKEYLERVFRNPFARDIILNNAHFEMAKIEAYDNRNYTKAREHVDYNIHHTSNKRKLAGSYSLIADIFYYQNKLDSAWHYDNQSLTCQPVPATFAYVYLQMAALAPKVGRSDSIEFYIQQHDHYIDTLYAISNQQAIRQVMNDHRVELEQRRIEEEHRRLVLTLSLAALALVIVVLAVLIWSLGTANRKKKQYIEVTDQLKQARMQEERQKTELTAAREEAEKLKTAYQDARSRVEELEKQHGKEDAYSEGADTSLTKRALTLADYEGRIRICADQFRQGLSWTIVQKYLHGAEHSLRKEERIAVSHDLNVCFTDYYEILQAEGKKVNQTEKTVSACYVLGLKAEEIEEILAFSDSTIRVQKHRLKEKIPADLYHIVFSFSSHKNL